MPVRNSSSVLTASVMIHLTVSGRVWHLRWLKSRNAKSVCMPPPRLMSLFKKVSPSIKPHFFSQKMDKNEPEKKRPSMAAKATNYSVKVDFWSEIQCISQSALHLMQGMVLTVSKRYLCLALSLMYVLMRSEQVLEWIVPELPELCWRKIQWCSHWWYHGARITKMLCFCWINILINH